MTADEVIRVVSRSPTKHCSLDPAPTWLVKRLLPCLADSIARMCNASLTEGIVPSLLKAAVVSPRLKKPTLDLEDMASYRPISNLSFISKTLERLVATRFVQHSETHHLLPSRQSSYRVNHSTETAAVSSHNNIVRAIDDGKVSLMVLLDLSAAFDTVNHDTLIQVLEDRFRVNGATLEWFKSYLTDRTQTFQVGSETSGTHHVTCGLPKGSVLGLKEFIA